MNVVDASFSWGDEAVYSPLPWQQDTFSKLAQQYTSDRLSHAYLVSGAEGSGVLQFMYAAAAGLLCKQPDGLTACGNCRSCQLLQAGGHPDAKLLTPEDAKVIKVDQVREAINFASTTAQQGGYRVIMIGPGEALNLNGANALLKLLEEPGEKTCLLIASYSPSALMPTLRSRCQKISLPSAKPNEAHEWLQGYGHDSQLIDEQLLALPLTALDVLQSGEESPHQQVRNLLQDLLDSSMSSGQFAKSCSSYEPLQLVDLLYSACLVQAKSQTASARKALLTGLDSLTMWRRQLLSGASLNNELYLQSWAIQLIKVRRT